MTHRRGQARRIKAKGRDLSRLPSARHCLGLGAALWAKPWAACPVGAGCFRLSQEKKGNNRDGARHVVRGRAGGDRVRVQAAQVWERQVTATGEAKRGLLHSPSPPLPTIRLLFLYHPSTQPLIHAPTHSPIHPPPTHPGIHSPIHPPTLGAQHPWMWGGGSFGLPRNLQSQCLPKGQDCPGAAAARRGCSAGPAGALQAIEPEPRM